MSQHVFEDMFFRNTLNKALADEQPKEFIKCEAQLQEVDESVEYKKYKGDIKVAEGFGKIGAVIVELQDGVNERFVDTISVEAEKPPISVTFSCKSWVQPKGLIDHRRIFFSSNKCRIYINGCVWPYNWDLDPASEKRIEEWFYVPRDEEFSEIKQSSSQPGNEKLLRKSPFSDLPELEIKTPSAASKFNLQFNIASILSSHRPPALKSSDTPSSTLVELPPPESYKRDKYNWLSDIEFARLTLVGLNPYSIQLVKSLPFMSKLDEGDYRPRESKFTPE
uniref:Lipoxygenase domain-containing protein n=1 Tax=Cucumis sativus TaxID=3659 RepID=A0A0A0KX73_CUCSA